MSRPPAPRAPAAAASAALVADRVGVTLPDGRPLLVDLTLGVGRERTGIVGPNGGGKSTLLRVLAGELAPGHGHVRRAGRVGYLPQEPAPVAGSVADALGVGTRLRAVERALAGAATPHDLDLAADAWDLADRAAEALARVGLAPLALTHDAAVLSGGERTRLALAALLLAEPDVLLLDEPTNHLDADGRAAIMRLVATWRGGVVVVSHDRALLGHVDRILELSEGGARLYGGNWAAYRAARDAEEAAAAAAVEQARAALRRAEREARAVRERKARQDARGQRSRATANQSRLQLNFQRETAQGTVGRLGAQVERALDASQARLQAAQERVLLRDPVALGLPATGLHARALVVAAHDVAWHPPGAARPVLAPVSLEVVGPRRIAVTGANGSGKTTLLRLLAGELAPTAGTLRRGVPVTAIAHLDQRASLLGEGGTLAERFAARHPALDAAACRHALARVGFRADAALRPVDALSGGERLRAALACVLAVPHPPRLLLLDEPTNHLDLDALAAVERALCAYDGAVVVVSHDRTFLDAIGVEHEVTLRRCARP